MYCTNPMHGIKCIYIYILRVYLRHVSVQVYHPQRAQNSRFKTNRTQLQDCTFCSSYVINIDFKPSVLCSILNIYIRLILYIWWVQYIEDNDLKVHGLDYFKIYQFRVISESIHSDNGMFSQL